MSFSAELLAQADHLLARDRRRPRQANLRRAVSAAYYALFHELTWGAASLIARRATPEARLMMQRWFEHTAMKAACGLFSAAALSGQLARLAGPTPLPNIQAVARAFRDLQAARHSADYDMASAWSRPQVEQLVQLAHEAHTAWICVRKEPQATIFALALLDLKRLQIERP